MLLFHSRRYVCLLSLPLVVAVDITRMVIVDLIVVGNISVVFFATAALVFWQVWKCHLCHNSLRGLVARPLWKSCSVVTVTNVSISPNLRAPLPHARICTTTNISFGKFLDLTNFWSPCVVLYIYIYFFLRFPRGWEGSTRHPYMDTYMDTHMDTCMDTFMRMCMVHTYARNMRMLHTHIICACYMHAPHPTPHPPSLAGAPRDHLHFRVGLFGRKRRWGDSGGGGGGGGWW